jgi:uncharacterized membrane protein YbhN (UPF0104 family)
MGIEEKVIESFKYKPILKWVIITAIFAFLGKVVWENWAQVRETSFTFQPFTLILATITFAFSYFIQVGAWYLITLRLGIALPFRETLESWFYSQLGKYLPGKVWLLLGRFYFYESKGKSRKAISIALYFETITLIVAGAFIFLAAFLFLKGGRVFPAKVSWWLILLFGLAFLSLHPRVLQTLSNWVLHLWKREPIFFSISYPEVLWILLVCLLSWGVGGIGFYFFVDAIYPVSSFYLLFLTGSLAVSSTLGLIALFAPGGLGVREGALVYLLSFLMPSPVAVIISVLTRLWMTLIEIGLIGVVYLIGQFNKSPGKGN